jgi:hypothetical protein
MGMRIIRGLLLGLMVLLSACSTPAKRKVEAPPYLEFRVEAEEHEIGDGVGFKRVQFNGQEILLSPPHRFFVQKAEVIDIGSERLGVKYWIYPEQQMEFSRWTGTHIGRRMAVLLNGRTTCCLKLGGALPGAGLLVGDADGFTEDEAEHIVQCLSKY